MKSLAVLAGIAALSLSVTANAELFHNAQLSDFEPSQWRGGAVPAKANIGEDGNFGWGNSGTNNLGRNNSSDGNIGSDARHCRSMNQGAGNMDQISRSSDTPVRQNGGNQRIDGIQPGQHAVSETGRDRAVYDRFRGNTIEQAE